MTTRALALLTLITACSGGDKDVDPLYVDGDGDHYSPAGGDCDDSDPDTYPGAPETWYDGVDQDCDDNDADQDLDGYAYPDDCADTDAAVHPGLADTIGDDVDTDCDGSDAGGFLEEDHSGAGLSGVSLDETTDHRLGLLISAAGEAGGDAGFLDVRVWDTETLDLDHSFQIVLSDGAGANYGLAAVDYHQPEDSVLVLVAVSFLELGGDGRGWGGVLTASTDGTWSTALARAGLESGVSASLQNTDAQRQSLTCTPGYLLWLFGTPQDFNDYTFQDLSSSLDDVTRCALTERNDTILVQAADGLRTYTLDGPWESPPTESGWTALDSHDGHVLLGGPDLLELRVDGVPTDVTIDGTPAQVRLGGDPAGAWAAAWTDASGGLWLTTVGAETQTLPLDAGDTAIDDLDVAWSTDGMLVVATLHGDVVRVSQSVLR